MLNGAIFRFACVLFLVYLCIRSKMILDVGWMHKLGQSIGQSRVGISRIG